MPHIEPEPGALDVMSKGDADAPVVMLNLLKYRAHAVEGHGVDGLSGEEAYRAYGREFAKLNPRFGGTPIWMGQARNSIIGDEDWDVVILVRYPTRTKFVTMIKDPDYQKIAPMRAAALADSRLVEMDQLLPSS
jgi:uncharacterized protein (DUF1330 family)